MEFHYRESAGTGPTVLKVAQQTGASAWRITPWINHAPLITHTHHWYNGHVLQGRGNRGGRSQSLVLSREDNQTLCLPQIWNWAFQMLLRDEFVYLATTISYISYLFSNFEIWRVFPISTNEQSVLFSISIFFFYYIFYILCRFLCKYTIVHMFSSHTYSLFNRSFYEVHDLLKN